MHFARDYGVSVIGGCAPRPPTSKRLPRRGNLAPVRRDLERLPAASSLFMQQPYVSKTLLIGERVNASGSKRRAIC
ncbi:MAG: hypothetical protein WKF30_19630 [Pyrinomonadaceae bacterium]